jgi:hypothetical protein
MPKLQPAVKTIVLPAHSLGPGLTSLTFASLSQIASIVNRRFYRAGLNWAVGGFKVITSGANSQGSVSISKLQETWITSAAWRS